jgi:hypothetical protein
MEGAAKGVADDDSAYTEVGAEVGAVGIEHVSSSVFAAKGHEVAAEIMERLDGARRKGVGVADAEPATGKGQGDAFSHRAPRGAARV